MCMVIQQNAEGYEKKKTPNKQQNTNILNLAISAHVLLGCSSTLVHIWLIAQLALQPCQHLEVAGQCSREEEQQVG